MSTIINEPSRDATADELKSRESSRKLDLEQACYRLGVAVMLLRSTLEANDQTFNFTTGSSAEVALAEAEQSFARWRTLFKALHGAVDNIVLDMNALLAAVRALEAE